MRILILSMLLCVSASAQPILRGPFTTNTAAVQYTLSTNIADSSARNATNSASVTNWINSRQPADAILSNQVGLATQAFTNTVNPAVSNLTTTNITVRSGASASNAFVGGTMFYSLASFTNLNGVPGTLTNLGNYSVPGHTITNNGDRIYTEWGGTLANNLANTNRFQMTWGGALFLDTGLMISSNTSFRGYASIIRSGISAQHVEAEFWFGSNAYARAFTNMEMTVDAGVAQTIALKGSSQRVGAHTNNLMTVEFKPGPR